LTALPHLAVPCIALSRVLIRHQTVSSMQANSCSEPGLLPHCKPLCLPGLMTNGMRVFSKTTQMLPLGMASTICSTLRLSRVGGHRQTNCAHRACCDSARSVPSHFPRSSIELTCAADHVGSAGSEIIFVPECSVSILWIVVSFFLIYAFCFSLS